MNERENNENPAPIPYINQYIPYYVPIFQYAPPNFQGYPPQFPMNPYAQRLPTPFNYSKSSQINKNTTENNENYHNNNRKTNESFNNYDDKFTKYPKEKPDPFKNKSADQIVNEFKAFTLPKLRLHRLIKLQARIKGWLVRRFLYPKKKIMHKIIEDYVEDKIYELIEVKSKKMIIL